MALIKKNPTLANTGRSFNGKTVQAYTIDLAVNATDFGTTEMGPNGAIVDVIEVLGKNVTMIMHSALRSDGTNAGQVFDVFFEGEFPTDTYDGTNAETFAAWLQSEVRLLTTAGIRTADTIAVTGESANVAGLDLSSATVVALTGSPFYADQIPA